MTDNGVQRTVIESYLIDALSFTEAEARAIEEMQPFISGEFTVSDIKRKKFTETFFSESGDRYYNVRLYFITMGEKDHWLTANEALSLGFNGNHNRVAASSKYITSNIGISYSDGCASKGNVDCRQHQISRFVGDFYRRRESVNGDTYFGFIGGHNRCYYAIREVYISKQESRHRAKAIGGLRYTECIGANGEF